MVPADLTRSSSYLNINETFVTDGGDILLRFREAIKTFSLAAAHQRLAAEQKAKREFSYASYKREKEQRHHSDFKHIGTQVGGSRPISSVSISNNTCLTGCWSGDAALWDLDELQPILTLENGHPDARVCSVFSLYPMFMLTGDSGGRINIWKTDAEEKPSISGTLSGHQGRISQFAIFPHFSNNEAKICSASSDTTWRIWDCATGACILLQEGHSKDVFAVDVHPDGALVATGGFDANGVVWDVRIGRPIFTLKGHSDAVVGLSFSSNGVLIATGSQDNTSKIWDLRKLKSIHTLLAHTAPLTGLKFCKSYASFPWGVVEGSPLLLTTSQDMTAKLWAPSVDWSQVALFSGHSGKVMQGDITEDASAIVTVSYDRTLRLWKNRNLL